MTSSVSILTNMLMRSCGHFFSLYMKLQEGLKKGVQITEGGASYHTSAYIWGERLDMGIVKMSWPAYSPDLNPIENVWSLFKRAYRKEV